MSHNIANTSTSTSALTASLPTVEQMKAWSRDDIKTFLQGNRTRLNLEDEDINKIYTQRVKGDTFLALRYEMLVNPPLSIPVGPAVKLIKFKETKSTTKAATRKSPKMPVLAWDDFLNNAFYASTALDTGNRIFSKPNVTGALSVEDSVVDMFLKTMEDTNNQRLILLPTPERWSKRYVCRAVKGQPDAIRCGAGNIQLLNDSDASLILSAVEVKPEQLMKTLVADGTELFNAYNTALTTENDGTTAIVRQLFGYMVVNDLKYGLLTTYIRTWFFYRQDEDPDNPYISPTVHINQSHTSDSASFLEYNDEYRPSSSKRSVLRRTFGRITRSQSKKGKNKLNDNEFLNSMKNYKRSQFSFGDVLGNGRSGVIFMTKLHEQVGALKMVDLYKKEYLLQEILNELKMYLGPLKGIQGIYIPKLLKYGVLHEAFVFILTSFAGESFANNRSITEKEKQLAINGLMEIHAKGVKHGDIRLENIMMKRNELTGHSYVWWIDFAWSKMINNTEDLDAELSELKHLLGMC
ncbi:11733_t:CDS:2 [Funneliformis mosseae]|uniref:11733_t:CDS:1 n=1 Tax=Funneliformis mosseae TaxID=27381 RepID=A0A9N8ZCF3_FUNMO|nr:11733_t:CDS:2 [Funneliformis mosseae]